MTGFGAVMNNRRYVTPTQASARGEYFCPACSSRLDLVQKRKHPYFRHKSRKDCKLHAGHPSESREHLHAKHYLVHIIEERGLTVNGVHIPAVRRDATRSVVLEKRVNTTRSYIVLDVAVIDAQGDVLYGFEVSKSHKTDMTTRKGFPAWEIAHDVIRAIDCGQGSVSIQT